MASEEEQNERMQELGTPVEKKHMLKESFSTIGSFLQHHYSSASSFVKKSLCSVICLVATILKTIPSPRFWNPRRVRVLQPDENNAVSNASSSSSITSQPDENNVVSGASSSSSITSPPFPEVESSRRRTINRGRVFERNRLRNDDNIEPMQPDSLVQSNVRTEVYAGSWRGRTLDAGTQQQMLREAVDNAMALLSETIRRDSETRRRSGLRPANRQLVAMLPITFLTEEILAKFDKDSVCCICQENFIVDDALQDLPCNHTFHFRCLKSWLGDHNLCPICRHELEAEDLMHGNHWKGRENEDEGAANYVSRLIDGAI